MVLRDKSAELSDTTSRTRMLEEERRRQGEYVEELESGRAQLEEHIRQLELRLRETGNNLNVMEESRTAIRAYEGNIEKLSGEIERLNAVLRKKVT
jgi:septal ring factor EnvC (AmiA/AmiB activator)